MASSNSRAHVAIVLDGVKAERVLKALAAEAKQVKEELEAMEKAGKVDTKEYAEQLRYHKQLQGEIRKNSKQLSDLDDVMKHLSTQTSRQLDAALRSINKIMKDVDLSTDEGKAKMEELRQQYAAISQQAKRLAIDYVDVSNTMRNLGTVSDKVLAKSIQQHKEERALLDPTEDAYKRMTRELAAMNKELDKRNGKMNGQQASQVFNNRTNADAAQIKQATEYYEKLKASLKSTNTKGLQEVNKRLQELHKQQANNIMDQEKFNEVLKKPNKASIEDLRRAEARLKEEIAAATGNQKAFNEKSKQLKQVQGQIKSVTGEFEKQESSLKKVANRLAAYVGIYGAFNFIKNQVTGLMKTNLEFSDTLSDIRKTTLMSEEAVALLSDRLKELDTRTAVIDVQKLAYEAGKLGITGIANVSEFVKAADQVNIALGEQLNGLESITELMKINQVLGTTQQYGIEQSLLKTGSAINYLSQTSTAVGGRMTDFTARLAGIASTSNMTTAEVLGLSAASDALKQQVEVSATAFNKLISQMFTNTKKVADAVGIEFDALREKLEMGDTMDALLMVLEAVRKKGGLSETGPIMKDLGSDGARLLQVLNAMAQNVDFVRDSVKRANKAFEEGTSVTNEYNIKNENAAALWERLKNNIEKLFVSSANTGWLKELIVDLQDLPKWIGRLSEGLWPIKKLIEGVVWSLREWGAVWAGFITAFSVQKILVGITAVIAGFQKTKAEIAQCETATQRLQARLNSNWFTLILTVIASVGYAIYDCWKQGRIEAEKFTRALAQALAAAEVEEQKLKGIGMEAEETFNRLTKAEKEAKDATEKFGKASKDAAKAVREQDIAESEWHMTIQTFNDKYSQYLGYQLQETANFNDMSEAIKAVNAELRMKAILEAKADREKEIRSESRETIEEKRGDLKKYLITNGNMTSAQAAEAIVFMREHPEMFSQTKTTTGNMGQQVTTLTVESYNNIANLLGSWVGANQKIEIGGMLQSYVGAIDAMEQKIADSNDNFAAELQQDAKIFVSKVDGVIKSEWSDIESFVDHDKEQQLQIMKDLKASQPKKSGELLDLRKKQVEEFLKGARLNAESLRQLTDADSQARLKELEAQMVRAENYLQLQLLRQDPNNNNNNNNGNNEALRSARDEYQAIISKIEAYYQMQRQVINDQYEKQEIDMITRENALREIEQRLLQSRIVARKRISDHATEEEWKAEQELMGKFNMAGEEGVNQLSAIADVGMQKISDLLKRLGGTAEWDAIFRKAEEDETKQQDLRIKRIMELEKMIIKHNALAKVTADYETAMRSLDLISDKFIKKGEEDVFAFNRRMMEIARSLGSQAGQYNLYSEEGLRQAREAMVNAGMDSRQVYGGTAENGTKVDAMSDAEIRAYFYQAYKYSEDYSSTSQRLAKQTLDAWEKTYAAGGDDRYFDDKINRYKQLADIAKRMEQYGLSEAVALENQLDAATALYAKEKSRLDAKMQKALDDRQAAANINDDPTRRESEISKADEEIALVQQEYDKLIPLYQGMMDAAVSLEEFNHRWIVSMKDAFVELGDQFISFRSYYEDNGSLIDNVFGTREERMQAFGGFVDNIKKAVRTAIMEKVKQRLSAQLQDRIELAWNKMFLGQRAAAEAANDKVRLAQKATTGAAEIATEQAKNAALETGNAAHNATMEGQDTDHTIKDVALSEASGVAKAFAQLGPVAGAVAVAMITAVIGSFLTMALNTIGHKGKKNETPSVKTKHVSGMLTYDGGNATDVLADNGRSYSAVSDPYATGLVTRPTVTTVGGSPALVAEEGPELVVGRQTTRALMMDYPGIVRTILNIERHHRRAQAHRAYALHAFDDGNAGDLFATVPDASPSGVSEQTLLALASSVAALNDRLSQPIVAQLHTEGRGGATDVIAQSMLKARRNGNLDSVNRLLGR